MSKIEIFCVKCNYSLGDNNLFAFYEKLSQGIHLIIKIEKRNLALEKFTLEEDREKAKKVIASVLICKCKEKLGKEINIGPKDEPIFCIKKEAIYFIKSINTVKRPKHYFDKKSKWMDWVKEYQEIEYRDINNFYGKNKIQEISCIHIPKVATNFPNVNDIFKVNIASLVDDNPRTYQIELYMAALVENTIIYLPTGSGKTLVAAMCSAYMKIINPNKKIIFVCDKIPLVFQQGFYLERQCNLSVGKFCSESKNSSEINHDILVFTADFLMNLLLNKTLYLGNCCLLIIDEIHHARDNHSFSKLIEMFYNPLDPDIKPRIVGMTASPSEMEDGVNYLCKLISGRIYLPLHYQNDFENSIYRPKMEYCITGDKSYEENRFLELIKMHVSPFLQILNPLKYLQFEPRYEGALKDFLNSKITEANINKNQKNLLVSNLLLKILNSIEILAVLGVKFASKHLNECIEVEEKNNKKSKVLNSNEMDLLNELKLDIKGFREISDKLNKLTRLLNQTPGEANTSRIIVFVRRRKTARLLCDYLRNDPEIKKNWNPLVFVGHAQGGLDGMMWFDSQEPTLNKFHDGISRLLVSTNVLQEGIDVTSCDKVIIFDRLRSITEYIQSRGRARKETSQFIMIGTRTDESFYKDLVQNESVLLNLVRKLVNQLPSHQKVPTDKLESLVELCKTTDKSQKYQKHEFKNSLNNCKFTLQVYLNKENDVEREKIFLSRIKTIRGYVQADECDNTLLSSDFENCIIYNCLFEIRNNNKKHKIDEEKCAFDSIKYLLSINNLGILWLEKKTAAKLNSYPNFQLMCENLEFGNLITPFKFMVSTNGITIQKKNGENIRFTVEYNMFCLSIMAFIDNKLHKFEIDIDSIDNLVCIDEEQNGLNMYLPFKRPPLVYTSDDETVTIDNFKNADSKYINWERRSFHDKIHQSSQDWTYKLKFASADKSEVINALKIIFPNRIIFSNVENLVIDYTIENFRADLKLKDFDSNYFIECLLSQNYSILNGKIDHRLAQLLNNSTKNEIKYIVEMLCLKLPTNRFIALDTLLKPLLEEILMLEEDDNEVKLVKNDPLKDLRVVYVKSCIITPSRILYKLPQPVVSNRVLRNFHVDNFLCVRIRDENLDKLNKSSFLGKMEEIYGNIEKILLNGISIFDRNFLFLAMSASQLRDHGCWLYASTDLETNSNAIRSWMGDFKSIKCIGKYAARLGQSLSSSVETFSFNSKDFKEIDDVKVISISGVEYIFTDGIGKISKAKAEQICKKYFNSKYISAFQIRFAGYKGVVAIDNNLSHDSVLEFRPSMKKFYSDKNKLDVINIAGYIPCNLNRQIIIILTALGIADSVFIKLQDLMLNQLNKILIDNNTASNYILKYFKSHYSFGMSSMIGGNLDFTLEPFYRDLLKSIYNYQLHGLIKKSRIFVEKGRILMGVIDETGLLKEDEVFIQCSIDSIINTNFKFYDEIIKSNRDSFIVSAKVVVAKNPCMHAGDVRVLKAVNIPELEHMINCIVFPCKGNRPITNQCSGSDLDGDLYFVTWEPSLIPQKLCNPLEYTSPPAKEKKFFEICIEDVIRFFVKFIEVDQLGRIANAHVAISDSSESGVKDPICVELALAFSLAVDFPKTGVIPKIPEAAKAILSYPDFMEKNFSSYESQKVIGKMYRKCKNIALSNYFEDKIELNRCFKINGHEKYLKDAIEKYQKYRIEIERLLTNFDCKTESDLLIGSLLGSSNKKSNESKSDFKISSELVKKLWLFYREDFFREFNLNHEHYSNLPRDVYAKASAWYVACYTHQNKKSIRILSFPFIVEDILSRFENIENFNILSRSIILKHSEYMKKHQLISRYVEKIKFKNYLSNLLEINLFTVGSIGLFLFEEINQIQQLIVLGDRELNFQAIGDILDEEFENVTCGDKFLRCEHDNETSFSISISKIDFKRFIYIRRVIFSNQYLFSILYVIVHFARLDRLFFAISNDNVTLEMFLIFCIDYFKKKSLITIDENLNIEEEMMSPENNDKYEEWMNLHESMKKINTNDIGIVLLNFYHEMSQFKFEKFVCNFEKKDFTISEKVAEILKDHFENAFNFMSKVNDISQIWNLVLSQNRLEPNFSRKFAVSRGRGIKTQSIFMENSSLLLFSNSKSELDQIEFEFYKGNRRSVHMSKHCYSAKLCSNLQQNNVYFKSNSFNAYKLHCMNQLFKAKEMNSDYDFRFQLKFGNVYFTIIEEANSISLHDFQNAMKKGYRNYKFEFHQNNNNPVSEETEIADENNVEMENHSEIAYENFSDSDGDYFQEKKTKKKRKRKPIKHATSAFDSNISESNQNKLNSIFENNEFETLVTESYIVYLEMKNKDDTLAYRLKYDFNFELKRIESLPIKWLCIDIRNQNEKKTVSYDLRFMLVSQKLIDLEVDQTAISNLDLFNKFKNGVIVQFNENSNQKLIVHEYFRNGQVFVRHSKATKYSGNFDCWKGIFQMAGLNLNELPDDTSTSFYEKINVSLIDVYEHSDNDEHGLFKKEALRKELIISGKIDINSLNTAEFQHLTDLYWYIARAFEILLE